MKLKKLIGRLLIIGALLWLVFGNPETFFEEKFIPEAFRLATPTPRAKEEPRIEVIAVGTGPTPQAQPTPSCERCMAWTLDGQEVYVLRWEMKRGKVVADVKDLQGNPVYGTALADPTQWQPMPTATVAREVVVALSEGALLPSSASGLGFYFLLFLAILGARPFVRLLRRGKGKGTSILIDQLEKRRK